MREFFGAIALMFLVLVVNVCLDNSAKKHHREQLHKYNGEKDDPNTDDSLPW